MLVDPFTGMPMEEAAPTQAPQSAVGAVGQSFMTDPNSFGYAVMANIPTLPTMIGWNMARGQNTIMGRGSATGIGSKMGWKSSVFNTLSPSRMFRLPDSDSVFQTNPKSYTPYNFGGSAANSVGKFLAGRETRKSAVGMVGRSLAGTGVTAEAIKDGSATLFDGGTLARLGVARRLSSMDSGNLSRRDAKRVMGAARSLEKSGAIATGTASKYANNPQRLAELTMRSFKGVHTQRLAGHLGGMMSITNRGNMHGGIPGSSLYDDAFNASRATIKSGVASINAKTPGALSGVDEVLDARTMKSASLAFQGAKAGNMKFAGAMASKAALVGGSKFIPIAGQVLLARDIMAMGAAGMKKGIEFSRDAAKSFQGQIQKPIFGMGYKDNAVNATSRARGLTAIQSSRLNARNALGNEAGMLANHYG